MKKSILIILVIVVALFGCRKTDIHNSNNELIIFHAGSLSVPFREISAVFMKEHPEVSVKAEASGSRNCARKVSDLGRRCDILASADYKVVSNLLIPDYADSNIRFASNEMVIAYTDRSRHSNKITSQNWPEILLKEKVSFGRSDPDIDPCGYRSLMAFQLAENYYQIPSLTQKLARKDNLKYIRPKETDLLVLLEADQIDYLFIYRSVAVQHGLKILLLPDEVNLKSPAFSTLYSTASVEVTGKKPGEYITRIGEPIVYSVSIPKNAPNQKAAQEWIERLLSPRGQAIMKDNGQPCITPPIADGFDFLPEKLRSLCIRND